MYYLAKVLQAAALTIILAGFLLKFPHLMSRTTLGIGIALFTLGWATQRFLVKGQKG